MARDDVVSRIWFQRRSFALGVAQVGSLRKFKNQSNLENCMLFVIGDTSSDNG